VDSTIEAAKYNHEHGTRLQSRCHTALSKGKALIPLGL
jgi:hypothetical protein